MDELMVIFCGEEISAPWVGSYGTFSDPIVLISGEEYVAQPHFVLPDGTIGDAVCQSVGCDYCKGYHSGCRCTRENRDLATVLVVG